MPRFDGDPVFNALLDDDDSPAARGHFSVELAGLRATEQRYEPNTAVIRTRLSGESGEIEVIDFAPRFHWRERMFHPQTLVRRLVPLSGTPRIRIRLRPTFEYGAHGGEITHGSNHVRFVGPEFAIRVTTNAPLDYVLDEMDFNLVETTDFIFGPDETLSPICGTQMRCPTERFVTSSMPLAFAKASADTP